jgi:protease II
VLTGELIEFELREGVRIIDGDAGHGGKSGRFDSLYEVAEEYAFVLAALDESTAI